MKAKIVPIRPLKLGPTQFKAEVERLQAEGRMRSLPELLNVMADARRIFVPVILKARRRQRKL
jgi:hypothetical protein